MALDTSFYFDPTKSASYTDSTKKSTETKGKQDLDMNDFIMLMVEQMKNQDMYSATDTSDYVNQLSQYTMVESLSEISTLLSSGMSAITDLSLSSYSLSMIGREATVATIDENGDISTITGIIEGVSYFNGAPQVIINGEQYYLSQVMTVGGTLSDSLGMAAAQAAKAAADAAQKAAEMLDKITGGSGSAGGTDELPEPDEAAGDGENEGIEGVDPGVSGGEETEETVPEEAVGGNGEVTGEEEDTQQVTEPNEAAEELAAEQAAAERLAEEG